MKLQARNLNIRADYSISEFDIFDLKLTIFLIQISQKDYVHESKSKSLTFWSK